MHGLEYQTVPPFAHAKKDGHTPTNRMVRFWRACRTSVNLGSGWHCSLAFACATVPVSSSRTGKPPRSRHLFVRSATRPPPLLTQQWHTGEMPLKCGCTQMPGDGLTVVRQGHRVL